MPEDSNRASRDLDSRLRGNDALFMAVLVNGQK